MGTIRDTGRAFIHCCSAKEEHCCAGLPRLTGSFLRVFVLFFSHSYANHQRAEDDKRLRIERRTAAFTLKSDRT